MYKVANIITVHIVYGLINMQKILVELLVAIFTGSGIFEGNLVSAEGILPGERVY